MKYPSKTNFVLILYSFLAFSGHSFKMRLMLRIDFFAVPYSLRVPFLVKSVFKFRKPFFQCSTFQFYFHHAILLSLFPIFRARASQRTRAIFTSTAFPMNFFLVGLCPYKHVILRKPHYLFQFRNAEHPHLDVNNSI